MDSSWDNGGQGAGPVRRGWPMWAKVLMGCGVAMLLALGACVGGTYWLAQKAKQDPEGFKRGALSFAMSQIKPDYEFAAGVVSQLRTDAGCRALWQAHPGMHAPFGTEEGFLETARGWRPHLADLEPLDPDQLEKGRLDLQKDPFSGVRFGYRMPDGSRLRMRWTSGSRRLESLEFTPSPPGAAGREEKP